MKNIYLTASIILGVVCVALYIENLSRNTSIYFFGETKSLATFFPVLMFIMGGLGIFVTLFLIAHHKEKDLKDTNTFDL